MGDVMIMGAGANDKCLTDADEMMEDDFASHTAFQCPYLAGLSVMCTVHCRNCWVLAGF